MGRWLVIAVAIGLLCSSQAVMAGKPGQGRRTLIAPILPHPAVDRDGRCRPQDVDMNFGMTSVGFVDDAATAASGGPSHCDVAGSGESIRAPLRGHTRRAAGPTVINQTVGDARGVRDG